MKRANRAGHYEQQKHGYAAFIPNPLPPQPPVQMSEELVRVLSRADRAVARLDGAASTLPNPDLFVAMYVRQEAVLSSQIEGTQSTLEDVLEFEIGAGRDERPRDVREVVNYVRAIEYGLERVHELPVCLRLIREIHAELLEGVRGQHRTPGEFRRSQNWIGTSGCTLSEAIFVPPPVPEMKQALADLEKHLYVDDTPPLIHCALAHAQFETIHPFLDGNGRMGRLLITFLLCQKHVLQRPLLYLSHYLKAHRDEYYEKLMAIRNEGDWEGWLQFFLEGVAQVGEQASRTAVRILNMREQFRVGLGHSSKGLKLLAHLFERPLTTVKHVEEHVGCSPATANNLVWKFCEVGILTETTGKKRYRRFRFSPYLELFEHPLGVDQPEEDGQMDQGV